MSVRSRPPTDEQNTAIYDPERARVELATPTEITPPPDDQSQPLRVISMKTPGDISEERRPVQPVQPRLRRLSEVSAQRNRAATPPGGLGYLAPPRDPREARTRRLQDYVLWGSIAVILAGAVTLGVWFLAGM